MIVNSQYVRVLLLVMCLGITWVSGCAKSGAASEGGSGTAITVIATTGQINSALKRITAGVNCNIKLFCGPGIDPHSFSASTGDVQAMLKADLIFYNGFHLEAKLSEHLEDTFRDKAWSMASAFPESDRLDWSEGGRIDPDAPFDPHIWNHLPAWAECIAGMADELKKLDPLNASVYQENADAYIEELNEVHRWAKEKLSKLPADRRTLISAHDAFGYFAKNYGMKTGAPLGVGNDAEANTKTMREIAQRICSEKIPAIFVETITNPKVSQALSEACSARGWEVKIVDQPLYSDDLGSEAPADTFLGAFKSNVNVIYEALSSEASQ